MIDPSNFRSDVLIGRKEKDPKRYAKIISDEKLHHLA